MAVTIVIKDLRKDICTFRAERNGKLISPDAAQRLRLLFALSSDKLFNRTMIVFRLRGILLLHDVSYTVVLIVKTDI